MTDVLDLDQILSLERNLDLEIMYSLDISIFYFLFNLGQKLGANWTVVFFASYLPYLIVIAFLYVIYKKEGVGKRFICSGLLLYR